MKDFSKFWWPSQKNLNCSQGDNTQNFHKIKSVRHIYHDCPLCATSIHPSMCHLKVAREKLNMPTNPIEHRLRLLQPSGRKAGSAGRARLELDQNSEKFGSKTIHPRFAQSYTSLVLKTFDLCSGTKN